VPERAQVERFEGAVMPHLTAAYNLARWLTRNEHDAEDLVQEAYLRALQSFDRYRGGDARAWLLTIVRNACYTWLRRRRSTDASAPGDSEGDWEQIAAAPDGEPEARSIRQADGRLIRAALEALPVEFREAFVLRELEGLSYKEIAAIADVPMGTVMSRLRRARQQMQKSLLRHMNGAE
jgi:RNA polymerase sigma-70 factor (ECF subfamily)